MAQGGKMKETENHPDNGYEPSMGKGSYEGIGSHVELKEGANSANQKSGEPFGKGGQ